MSSSNNEPIVRNTTEARQGETSGHMQWALGISLLLAIIVLGGLYLLFMR
jgi:hypothetical protein